MSVYPIVDAELVRRIEAATTADLASYADSARACGIYPETDIFRVAGGIALWFSQGNVVNGAFGLGLNGPVEQEEIAALIDFLAAHGAPASIGVCPHADPSLLRWLAHYGFVATDFETVLYQPLPSVAPRPSPAPSPSGPAIEVRIAKSEQERTLWAELEARGFRDDEVSDDDLMLARALSLRPDALPFIGYVDGEPAGTGMLVLADGVAMFNGDSTLPAMRGRGVQSAILAERLRYAAEHGATLAVIEADPGGTSERNQQRAGFRVAYTRVSLERPVKG